jgi:hypothetical protein
MLIGLAFSAQAQDISKNALGLRFETMVDLGRNYLIKELCLAITVSRLRLEKQK